eukprot:GHRR01013762.1.p4 GENE.GHRR01013762.1~~GHRR01013762.1.p4  ORF type:complete len:117 (+),score=37.09 GHRR01013762.1:4575-4925(+)
MTTERTMKKPKQPFQIVHNGTHSKRLGADLTDTYGPDAQQRKPSATQQHRSSATASISICSKRRRSKPAAAETGQQPIGHTNGSYVYLELKASLALLEGTRGAMQEVVTAVKAQSL